MLKALLTLIKRLVLMVQFLTAIPIPLSLKVDNRDFGKGLIFAPVVGLVLGGILGGAYLLLDIIFPAYVSVVIVVILYIVLTGGLHLDGLGDTFDGLYSNRTKEKILEIMRDSRVGTNALLAVLCVVILDMVLLFAISAELDAHIVRLIVLMPAAGRIGSLIGAGASVYARKGEGLGKSFIDYCGVKEIILGSLLYMGIFLAVTGISGVGLALLPMLSAFVLIKLFSRKIDGATGDILGAVCELNQTVFLIWGYIMLKILGF